MISVAEPDATREAEAGFLDLYDMTALSVLRYLRGATPDGTDLEDLCADVFARAWRAWPGFRGVADDARHWLFRIARNTAIDAGRRRHGIRVVSIDAADATQPGRPIDDQAVERIQVRAALARLNQYERELVSLRTAGLSHQEIAAIVGRSEAAVKMAWHRAMGQLRTQLEARDD
jgi:RNA polymerase sigma-70 factor (ECF subfamily)